MPDEQPATPHESTAHKILTELGHVVNRENIELVASLIIEFEQAKHGAGK